ncbi:MAG TPA: DUF3500 domain-containing protein [Gemmataceae bacterium]|nr:DUF3500 domain-containing protein [Gemmataceae bacterium]
MDKNKVVCPDCEGGEFNLDRRGFLRVAGAAAAAALPLGAAARVVAAPSPKSAPETAVKALYETLDDKQKKEICFAWDHKDTRGLLRTHVSNNWQVTKQHIRAKKGDPEFYTDEQRRIIYDIFKGLLSPEYEKQVVKQLKDDTGGAEWGAEQSIAIFGKPGDDKFEFVMTGRHLTLRADGNSEKHVAFGGPIFYGHAASGFTEKKGHPGNVFWHQAQEADKVYAMLSGKQQEKALVKKLPKESAVAFRGDKGGFPGIAVTEFSADQKKELQRVLSVLLEHYRKDDQDEALECLKKQGGLDKCSLAFYEEGHSGDDKEWDTWRVEGPAFVWYFRGTPHVHVWVNVADDPSVETNAKG